MFSYKIRNCFFNNTHIDSQINLMKDNLTFNQKSSFIYTHVLPAGNTITLQNKKLAFYRNLLWNTNINMCIMGTKKKENVQLWLHYGTMLPQASTCTFSYIFNYAYHKKVIWNSCLLLHKHGSNFDFMKNINTVQSFTLITFTKRIWYCRTSNTCWKRNQIGCQWII